MGTHAHINILDEDDIHFTTIYCQYDGYPSGVGNDIYNILGHRKLVNGFNDERTQVNGMHDAAALLVAGMKSGIGNIYIYGPQSNSFVVDYTYNLWTSGSEMFMSIYDFRGENLYNGPLADFSAEKIK